MNNKEKKYDLIKFEDGDFSLDVKVSPYEDTVWLSQNEMAMLFDTTKQNISLHIKNIMSDGELDVSVVKDFLTTASDGKKYLTKMYNLDMIIAVGYRVNSKRGTLFRRWASFVLKQYLLNGYAVNSNRVVAYESNLLKLEVS